MYLDIRIIFSFKFVIFGYQMCNMITQKYVVVNNMYITKMHIYFV